MSSSFENKLYEEFEATVDGHIAIAIALMHVANAINRLGTNDAATQMGAIELLAGEVKSAAAALSSIDEAIRTLEFT